MDGLTIADRSFKVIPHIVTFYSHTGRIVEFTFDDIRLLFMLDAMYRVTKVENRMQIASRPRIAR